jgi:23S rRNA (cytosine1962-C5)-methyltransferase
LASSDSGRADPRGPGIDLAPGRDGPVRKRRHPWIYSQAVAEVRPAESPGELLPVRSANGAILGWGFPSPDSLIAVRMVGFAPHEPPPDWIEQRIRAANALRSALRLDSDAVRLVNAEGDFIPGLVVDVYGDTVVVSPHIHGIESLVERIVSCLESLFPGRNIYVKRDEHYARVERLSLASGYARGTGDGTTVITEGGSRLIVDFARGQKTGFYLDQRDNRTLVSRWSAGRTVLNLFAYTGAVAIRAAAAGAVRLVSVESSRKALETARACAGLNAAAEHEWIAEDVFSYLGGEGIFDLVVADPPPFARRRAELEGALKGYTTLFKECILKLGPGGLGFFFSCSGAVDRPTFQGVVSEAALRSGRRVRLLRELHADVDHPVAATHPEGEYLKGWMVHAE